MFKERDLVVLSNTTISNSYESTCYMIINTRVQQTGTLSLLAPTNNLLRGNKGMNLHQQKVNIYYHMHTKYIFKDILRIHKIVLNVDYVTNTLHESRSHECEFIRQF